MRLHPHYLLTAMPLALAVDATRERALDTHPDNGRRGYWRVDGAQRAVIITDCVSARDARDRARQSGIVPWTDFRQASFLGETLPEVVEVLWSIP